MRFLDIIHDKLEWEDFAWGENSLIVKEIKYEALLNYKYYPTQN